VIAHGNPPCDHVVRAGAAASTASRPAFVTTRTPLFMRRDDGRGHHFRKRRSGLFFTSDLDDPNHVELASEIRLQAQRGFISFASADRVILAESLLICPTGSFLLPFRGVTKFRLEVYLTAQHAGQWRPLANRRARLIMIHPPCISDPRSACPPIKNAIGTLGKCLSEFDIRRRRLTVLSWIPARGKTQESRASLESMRAFLITA
jgi:hypothetical protein